MLMQKIEVLHGQGYVKLVDCMGNDRSIVNAARVSYDMDLPSFDANLEERDKKLLRYLLVNKHTSPFEHVQFSFEVSAPIFVFRQWHRHRTWSYNEISARYTKLPEHFYIPAIDEIGIQHVSNKQMRTIKELLDEERVLLAEDLALYEAACRSSYSTYLILLDHGWPRELARAVLPVAFFSRMEATVDLHNLMGFLRLRLHKHAQKEIQEYAVALLTLMYNVAPVTTSIFTEWLMTQDGYGHVTLGKRT